MAVLLIIAFVYVLFTSLEMAFKPCAHCVHITSLSYPSSGEAFVINAE
jgi:hypothetical protein